MTEIKENLPLKIHLIISILVVVPASLIYGFNLGVLLDIQFGTNDEQSFAKGVMGLYLAFSILWCFGIFNPKYLKAALYSNCLFMLGLGLGRIVSILIDGWPTIVYTFGMLGELLIGFYGAFIINTKYSTTLK